MSILPKTEHLKRYKDVAMLLVKYGRSDLVKSSGLEAALVEEDKALAGEAGGSAAAADGLADDLERLGPTFVKLGQLLSTRADLLPAPYLEALTRLQDKVGPFSFGEVEKIVESELGVRLSKAFAHFEAKPIASASLGQVHRARMRDGREVVVKVQRPDIRQQMVEDFDALEEVAGFLDARTEIGRRYDFSPMVTVLRQSVLRELDYREEASNLLALADNLQTFETLVFPRPVLDFTTSRVLTMEFVAGKKITDLSPLGLMEIDGARLAEQLFRAYLQQILVDGIFHADPHPGNVFLTDDSPPRVALIDLGMVGRVTSNFQDNLLRLLLAISEGRGEEAAQITIGMGEKKGGFDEGQFRRKVGDIVVRHTDASLNKIDAGAVVLEITRIAADCDFRLPPEFTMIAKTLLNLDRVVYTLSPSFDPNKTIRRYATEILQHRMLKALEPGNVMTSLIDLKEFVERLPSRVNKILDAVGNNDLQIKVDALDEKVLMEGAQKIANRITVGLVIGSMIVGAALLMRVDTAFKIFGYPGIAIIFFLLAGAAAIYLVVTILFYDQPTKKRTGQDEG
ncbi:MAG TPA: AarF/UbiB family protein [Pyrinomonadaceae bacterium]|jgi:predicted unusual protein kinase regulating ubiquinone biosynthesis (AarF/ABC1/UbiB family)